MITEQDVKEMTSNELAAYMRGYRDGQVDLYDLISKHIITTTTGTGSYPWTIPSSPYYAAMDGVQTVKITS